MPRTRKRTLKDADVGAIPSILGELNSLLEAFDDEDPEDIEYRLDALATTFLDARLVSRRRLRRLKFHVVIEELTIELPERDALSQDMQTFQDLINAYGDEPSEEEIDEAKDILVKVISALKAAFEQVMKKNQLRLDSIL